MVFNKFANSGKAGRLKLIICSVIYFVYFVHNILEIYFFPIFLWYLYLCIFISLSRHLEYKTYTRLKTVQDVNAITLIKNVYYYYINIVLCKNLKTNRKCLETSEKKSCASKNVTQKSDLTCIIFPSLPMRAMYGFAVIGILFALNFHSQLFPVTGGMTRWIVSQTLLSRCLHYM